MMRCNDEAQSVILVSGATGFMGSAIARHLMAGGMSVRAMGRSAKKKERVLTGFPEGRAAAAEGRLSFVAADVTQPETLTSAVEGVDCIIQAAQFPGAVSYTHLRAHETKANLVCRLLLEKKQKT